jgi:hypothetical protein
MINQVGFDPNEHRSQCEAYLGYFLGERVRPREDAHCPYPRNVIEWLYVLRYTIRYRRMYGDCHDLAKVPGRDS